MFHPNIHAQPTGTSAVMLPTAAYCSVEQLGDLLADPNWILEEKVDGKRFLLEVAHGTARFLNRAGDPTNLPDPATAEVLRAIDRPVVLDGELHLLGGHWRYVVWDILSLDGEPTLDLPLRERRYVARDFVVALASPLVTFAHATVCGGPEVHQRIVELHAIGAEGFVLKHLGTPYRAGRVTPARGYGPWIKHVWVSEATVRCAGPAGKRWAFKMEVLAPCPECHGNGQASIAFADDGCRRCNQDGESVWVPCGLCTVPWNSHYDMQRDFVPGVLVEVRYLYATADHILYQPRIAAPGIRDDISEMSRINRGQFRYRQSKEA